jgi:hypothetical protein
LSINSAPDAASFAAQSADLRVSLFSFACASPVYVIRRTIRRGADEEPAFYSPKAATAGNSITKSSVAKAVGWWRRGSDFIPFATRCGMLFSGWELLNRR